MRYVKLENDVPKNYSIEQLLLEHPGAEIYHLSEMPNKELLANYNVYPLVTEAMPTINEDEIADEGVPEFRDNEWHQTWKIRKLTLPEINAIIEKQISDISVPSGVFVDEETKTARYNICQSCEFFTVFKTCSQCKCVMPIKVRFLSASCPVDKW